MANNDQQLAVAYAALILQDDGVEISAENITSILSAANVSVEKYWPLLFAKHLAGQDLAGLITSVSAAGAAPAAGGAGGAGGAAGGDDGAEEAAEEKKSSSESDDDMGFSLFG